MAKVQVKNTNLAGVALSGPDFLGEMEKGISSQENFLQEKHEGWRDTRRLGQGLFSALTFQSILWACASAGPAGALVFGALALGSFITIALIEKHHLKMKQNYINDANDFKLTKNEITKAKDHCEMNTNYDYQKVVQHVKYSHMIAENRMEMLEHYRNVPALHSLPDIRDSGRTYEKDLDNNNKVLGDMEQKISAFEQQKFPNGMTKNINRNTNFLYKY